MMRTDINLAIVAMVKMPPPITKNITSEGPQYCFAASDLSSENSTSEVLLQVRYHITENNHFSNYFTF